jgi:hypothetical protein
VSPNPRLEHSWRVILEAVLGELGASASTSTTASRFTRELHGYDTEIQQCGSRSARRPRSDDTELALSGMHNVSEHAAVATPRTSSAASVPMPTSRVLYGDDARVTCETVDDVVIEGEGRWVVFFRGEDAIDGVRGPRALAPGRPGRATRPDVLVTDRVGARGRQMPGGLRHPGRIDRKYANPAWLRSGCVAS